MLKVLFRPGLSPRTAILTSPSGVFILAVSLEAFKMVSALEVAYGIGGRWVSCPFLHSWSLKSVVGVELIVSSKCR